MILGRNTTVYYNDSERTIKGQDGAMQLGDETTVIIGRRQPQDSKLVVWSKQAEIEIGEYNPRAGIIPSRVHGAFVSIQGGVYYTDLCSSSGTVIVGDSSKEGQFVKIYDSGTAERPRLKVDTIYMSRKA